MKDKNSMNAEERALAEMLAETAAQVEIGASFQNELEKKLMNAHKPKTGFGLFSFGKAASTLASVFGLAILALIFVWAIRAISSKPQPAFPVSEIPTATPTAVKSTLPPPTATFETLPTFSSILFRDDFEDTLGNDWQWTHENSEQWNLTDSGWLEIMVSYGIINNSNMDNLLLRQAPTGNFELETTLNFTPMEAPQMAGLLIYENNANYVELVHGACLTQPCLGDAFYFDQMTRGGFIEENFATPVFGTGAMHLRLRFEGGSFTAYASENGIEWKLIGAHSQKIQPLYIGLFAGGSFDRSAQIPAQFDYFIVNALP